MKAQGLAMDTFHIAVASLVALGGLLWTVYQGLHRRAALIHDLEVLKRLTELKRSEEASLVLARVERLIDREYRPETRFPVGGTVYAVLQIAIGAGLGVLFYVGGFEVYKSAEAGLRQFVGAASGLAMAVAGAWIGWHGVHGYLRIREWRAKRAT